MEWHCGAGCWPGETDFLAACGNVTFTRVLCHASEHIAEVRAGTEDRVTRNIHQHVFQDRTRVMAPQPIRAREIGGEHKSASSYRSDQTDGLVLLVTAPSYRETNLQPIFQIISPFPGMHLSRHVPQEALSQWRANPLGGFARAPRPGEQNRPPQIGVDVCQCNCMYVYVCVYIYIYMCVCV